MKRLFSALLGLFLVATTVGATDFSTYDYLDYHTYGSTFGGSSSGTGLTFYTPLTDTLTLLTPPRAYPGTTGTFTRASTQLLVNDSNVLTSFGSGVPATNSDGVLLEPASTNKVTAYGVIPADTLGSELSSGNLTLGQKYQITARTDADFTADGAADNNVGTQFVATAATVTLDAGDKVKRVQWGVGEKSFYSGSAFIQNITGLTLSGDTTAVLSIVTDETEITAAGLGAINPGFKVYKLDNSAGSTSAYVVVSGTVGNTNVHTTSAIVRRVSGTYADVGLSATSGPQAFTNATYSKVADTQTPSSSTRSAAFGVNGGTVVHFLMPMLEAQPAATSYILTAGSTGTRAITGLEYATAGNMFAGPMSGTFYWTPQTTPPASEKWMWGSYTDANNAIGCLYDGTNVIFRKRVGGTSYDATKALTAAANTTYKIGWRVNADNSTDVFVNSVKGTGNADTTAPVLYDYFYLGEDGNMSGMFSQQIRDFTVYRKVPPDSRM